MSRHEHILGKVTALLDQLAGVALLIGMFLVVFNVVLRTVAGKPILGAYEYVGFINAAVIGLALAHCAFQNSHIAVGIFVDKLSERVRLTVETLTQTLTVLFLGVFSLHIVEYAQSKILTGEVSPTTKTPFYPFVLLVAAGLAVLCLVPAVRLLKSTSKVIKNG